MPLEVSSLLVIADTAAGAVGAVISGVPEEAFGP